MKLEFHGTDTDKDTDTDIRDAVIVQFCKRVQIAYRVQYTLTRVHARIPNGHPREEKRACRTSRRTSRRGSSCLSGSCGKLNGEVAGGGHADILATILARKSARMSVSVWAPWNASLVRYMC